MTLVRISLWATVVAMLDFTFVWPYTVSADPADEMSRIAAITAFVLFFVMLVAALILRCRDPRTSS